MFGHVGNQNLGDEAIIAAVIQNLRERLPEIELLGFTIRPEDTATRHGIPSHPIRRLDRAAPSGPARSPGPPSPPPRDDVPPPPSSGRKAPPAGARAGERIRGLLRAVPPLYAALRALIHAGRGVRDTIAEIGFLVASYRRLRGVHLLLVAGSNQLSDYVGGPWGFPYTLWKWTLLARAAGADVAFASVGAGPIHSRLSARFLRAALRRAVFRSVRDVGSMKALASIGAGEGCAVAPDLAHSLNFTLPARPPGTREIRIGINPIPYFDPRYWPERDPEVYAGFVSSLAGFASWLTEQGHRVEFFATQLRADPQVIDDIRARVSAGGTGGATPGVAPVATIEELLAVLAGAEIVVAARFHGIVLAHMVHTPTLAIAYRRGHADLLADMGLEDWAIRIEDVTPERLIERFALLAPSREAASRAIARRVEEHREALDRQYDRLLGIRGR